VVSLFTVSWGAASCSRHCARLACFREYGWRVTALARLLRFCHVGVASECRMPCADPNT
jgi:hypothetical protein